MYCDMENCDTDQKASKNLIEIKISYQPYLNSLLNKPNQFWKVRQIFQNNFLFNNPYRLVDKQ